MDKKPLEQCPSQVNIVINGNFLPGLINGLLTSQTTIPTILTPHHVTSPKVVDPIKRVKLTPEERDRAKQERERIRQEREEIKAKKEAEKKAKLAEREQIKRERAAKKEKEEREKQERIEARQAEQQRKLKEKEEAKKIKEKERELKIEQAAVEKLKAKERFMGFFNKPKATAVLPKETAKSNSIMDPTILDTFETLISKQNVNSDYLLMCKHNKTNNHIKQQPTLKEYNNNTVAMDTDGCHDGDVQVVSSVKKFKLLQFHDNNRPPYYGTWSKVSSVLSPRNPLKMDKELFDYECDSDEEWEEEDPGESVSDDSEEEKESGEDEEDEDGFFVPHGYLSEGEGDQSDDENNEKREQKHLAKAKAWEAEFSRQFKRLVPIKVGVVWSPSNLNEKSKTLLLQYSAVSLVAMPIKLEPRPLSDTPSHYANFPEEALPDLIKLVHSSTNGIKKLIDTFQTHWLNKTGHNLSKRQLSRKIVTIATKETRPPSIKPQWYVQEPLLSHANIDGCGLLPSPVAMAKKGLKRSSTPSIKEFFKSPSSSSENVPRRLYDITNEPKKIKLTPSETTPTNDDVVIVEDTVMECKENYLPCSFYGDEATPIEDIILVEDTLIDTTNIKESNLQPDDKGALNCHGKKDTPNSIDWKKCMSSSVQLTIPVDCHI